MVNALFSSKKGGTKHFKCGKDHSVFGWDAIIAMYQREVGRAKQQLTRMVPRLKEVHVVRDAWTKLNVSPAKIMQVYFSILYVKIHNALQQEQVLDTGMLTKTHDQLMLTVPKKHGSICKLVISFLRFAFYPHIKEHRG